MSGSFVLGYQGGGKEEVETISGQSGQEVIGKACKEKPEARGLIFAICSSFGHKPMSRWGGGGLESAQNCRPENAC